MKCQYKQKVFSSLKYNEYQQKMDAFFKANPRAVISTGRQTGKSMYSRHLALDYASKRGKNVSLYVRDDNEVLRQSKELDNMITGVDYKKVRNCTSQRKTLKEFDNGGVVNILSIKSISQISAIPISDIYLADEVAWSTNFNYLIDSIGTLDDSTKLFVISTPNQGSSFNALFKSNGYPTTVIPVVPTWDIKHLSPQQFEEEIEGKVL